MCIFFYNTLPVFRDPQFSLDLSGEARDTYHVFLRISPADNQGDHSHADYNETTSDFKCGRKWFTSGLVGEGDVTAFGNDRT